MNSLDVITIDGPAGVGKSTVARRLAQVLGIAYLDTGAMYRVLGLHLGAQAADLSDEALRQKLGSFAFSLKQLEPNGEYRLFCNNMLVGDEIRRERAGRLASIVAKLPAIRETLGIVQQEIAAQQPLVAEGRDMGTRVFPQARHKFFLDARPEVRAHRRYLELQEKGIHRPEEEILADITVRDTQDRNRAIDPLRPAPDALVVDTSDIDLDGVLARLWDHVRAKAVAEPGLSHLDADGKLHMVDVGAKTETQRIAKASATVHMAARTLELLRDNALPKGDVLAAAKIAGIMAAKRTWEFIPLCHPLNITKADIRFALQETPPAVLIEAEVHTFSRTGVEMEALMAAQVAAATIYDMAKAVQKDMVIDAVRLMYKSGGKSGEFVARD